MRRCWRKFGQIYAPETSGRHPKLASHASNPLPVHLGGNIFRIFYSGRDAQNRSSVGAVDVDIKLRSVVADYNYPFFEHGPEGSFFADGVSIGNCYEVNGVRYMLFMGWQAPVDGHWRGDVGRLIVNPDLTLSLDSLKPFMSSDVMDPISLSYPWVLPKRDNGFDMWYGSTLTWDAGNGEMLHVINHAVSSDGNHWSRKGLAIPYQLNVAQAFSRPSVLWSQDEGYQMWFSYRSGTGQKYRIGYAVSRDSYDWELRLGDSGIDVSETGWDSEMIEYPFVFNHEGDRYMLYNGNGNGKTGFGLAILE